MAQLVNVRLSRVDAQPWGLRLQGGKDFGTPLVVQKVNHGSIADKAGVQPGDSVVAVNNVDCFNLRHKDAQDLIVRSGNSFELTIQRGGSTWKPSVAPTGSLPSPGQQYGGLVTKTSLQHHPPPNEQHIGCGYNNSARPFNENSNVKSIVNKQYNTPVGMYSEESIAETLTAQAEVLANGVLGVNFKKNEKAYNSAGSEVLKALKESENDPQEPAATNFFWTASHAIGTYSSVSSRTNTPNHLNSIQQQKLQQHQALDQYENPKKNVRIQDECIGISLQQNTLAPDAAYRPSLPAMTTDKIDTPIVDSGDCAKTIKPCDECGASMINSKLGAPTISAALTSHQNGIVKSDFGGPRPFGDMTPNARPKSPAKFSNWAQPKPTPTPTTASYGNNNGSNILPTSNFSQNAPGRNNTDYRATNYKHQGINQNRNAAISDNTYIPYYHQNA